MPAPANIAMTMRDSQLGAVGGGQFYNSFVVTTTFPGMPGYHDWNWRPLAYSSNPGNGARIWVGAPATVTFNVNR